MNDRTKQLSTAARQLSKAELAELVDDLLAALHQADPDWNRAWGEEAERRIEAYRAGRTQVVPAEEVLARLTKR